MTLLPNSDVDDCECPVDTVSIMTLPTINAGVLKIGKLLGLVLQEARKERSYSLSEISTKTGISKSYLSEIENGKKIPEIDKLQIICDAIDVPIYVILFKSLHEDDLYSEKSKNVLKDIKPLMDKLAKKLYS